MCHVFHCIGLVTRHSFKRDCSDMLMISMGCILLYDSKKNAFLPSCGFFFFLHCQTLVYTNLPLVLCVCDRVCSWICVWELHLTLIIKSALHLSQPHLVALCGFAKENQSLLPRRRVSLRFTSHRNAPLWTTGFNWKVMKFLFKEMIQVYEHYFIGVTQDSLISV